MYPIMCNEKGHAHTRAHGHYSLILTYNELSSNAGHETKPIIDVSKLQISQISSWASGVDS